MPVPVYYFDSYAIIEALEGKDGYAPYANQVMTTSAVNLCEAYYFYLREGRGPEFLDFLEKGAFDLLEITSATALEAARFRHGRRKQHFSYADALSYALAQAHGLIFLTGDKEFRDLDGVEFVK